MDSIERIINYYNKSKENDLDHNVIESILAHLDQIADATIYDLADFCYTSTSTISRLIKKMEFESYTDFKSQLIYALRNYEALNQNTRDIDPEENEDIIPLYFNFLQNNISALKETLTFELIQTISDHLYQADQVLFFSVPEVGLDILQKEMFVTQHRSNIFNTLKKQQESLEKITLNTVVLAIVPNLMEMSGMRSILKQAKEKGAFVITICSKKRNDYVKHSDLQLTFEGTKTSMDLYLFMIIINIIKYDLSNRYTNRYLHEMFD